MPVLVNMPSLDPSDIVKAKNDIEALKTNKADKIQISNPNLLDNPWFTVNQRQGKIVLSGVTAYSDPGCTTVAETTTTPCAIPILTSTYGKYTYNDGTNDITRYVKAEDVVDGYEKTKHEKYSIDRWKWFDYVGDSYLKLNSDGIEIHKGSLNDSNCGLFQVIDIPANQLFNKALTVTIIEDNFVTSNSGIFDSYDGWIGPSYWHKNLFIGIQYNKSLDRITIEMNLQNSSNYPNEINIRAIKLEIGEVSTLHMDTAPNYATELLKCQRYFYRIGGSETDHIPIGYGRSNDNNAKQLHVQVQTPVPMREKPTININGSIYINTMNGQSTIKTSTANYTGYIASNYNQNNYLVDFFTFDDLDINCPCDVILYPGVNNYIDFSADL